jgi:hypothetical protein
MNNYNFIISACDTDSITFSKEDMSEFSPEEVNILLNEINSQLPQLVKLDLETVYDKILVLKAKNYILLERGKIKYKGSALRSPKLEKALTEFIHRIVDSILYEKNDYVSIYNEYAKEIMNITDINRWATRITVSAKTLESTRTNETKIMDALEGSEFVEGDRRWVFFKEDESLCLAENFSGDYNKSKLLEKLYKTAMRFSTVLDKSQFINYKLKKNNKSLIDLLSTQN